jgi:CHAT domain-containing protein
MMGMSASRASSNVKRSTENVFSATDRLANAVGADRTVVDEVIKNARHVLVVPSGPLTSLPFHLLVTEKPAVAIPELKDIGTYRDAAWLVKRQAVSMFPALASLKTLRRVAGQPGAKPMVGFGDPVFDPAERAKALAETGAQQTRAAVTRGYGDFWQGAGIDRAKLARHLPSLLYTANELKTVAAKLGAAPGDVHLGSDASETVVKRTALADYRVVYFATHGLVAGDVKGLGEPSLALTFPKQPTNLDDGLLTASEMAQLKLNADWVVLSACNTAAADKPGAEALSGLARAFFYAGARALLVSHWSVDTEAATRLTTSTFAIMKADPKLGRAEALRKAMLDYMNDKGSPLNGYPAFWGPFSIIGEGAAR